MKGSKDESDIKDTKRKRNEKIYKITNPCQDQPIAGKKLVIFIPKDVKPTLGESVLPRQVD